MGGFRTALRFSPLLVIALGLGIFLALQVPETKRADANHNVLTTLIAGNSGKCLSVYPGDLRNGAVAYQWTCGGGNNIYVENAGDFVVPFSAVEAVHAQKVILKAGRLAPELREAIGHAHDAEEP